MKPRGRVSVAVIWLIFFWPAAIVYALMRDWSKERQKIEN